MIILMILLQFNHLGQHSERDRSVRMYATSEQIELMNKCGYKIMHVNEVFHKVGMSMHN